MSKTVMCVALDGDTGVTEMIFGNDLKVGKKTASVKMGGGTSYPIVVSMYMTALKSMKDKIVENSKLEGKELYGLEKELYDIVNVSVGCFLDREFPEINKCKDLTEEACKEAGLDFKTADSEKILEAEENYLEKHYKNA